MPNRAAHLAAAARIHGVRPAAPLDDQVLDQAYMDSAARAVPGDLVAQGTTPGDKIGPIVPDVPAFPVLFYAALYAGGIEVLMNPQHKIGVLECYLHDSATSLAYGRDGSGIAVHGAAAAIGIPSVTVRVMGPEGLAGEPPTAPAARGNTDTAVTLCTLGTTGGHKGADLTHRNLDSNARTVAETRIEATERDSALASSSLGLSETTRSGSTSGPARVGR